MAAWVDNTFLQARLVYYLVRPDPKKQSIDLHPDSLVKKLVLKPDSTCYGWLEQELAARIIRTMHGYRRNYPLETREVDDAVPSGPEYRAMLDQLRSGLFEHAAPVKGKPLSYGHKRFDNLFFKEPFFTGTVETINFFLS